MQRCCAPHFIKLKLSKIRLGGIVFVIVSTDGLSMDCRGRDGAAQ